MAKKRLLVDMDGTLARFHDQANYLERMFEKDFFRELEPFTNMVEGVRQFMQDHPDVEVFIVSARVIGEPPYCEVEKNAWLDRYLPEIDREHRIFTDIGHSKAEYLPGGATKDDYLLDDYNRGLNLFMYDGGSAVKCHNNINQRGLGAYGGEKGQLWTGAMVNVDDKPEMISAELAQSMGLSYDRKKVFAAYADKEPVLRQWSQEKKDAFIAPEREAVEGSLLDQIRFYSFDPRFENLSFPGMSPGEKINIPRHKAQAICMNEFGTDDLNSVLCDSRDAFCEALHDTLDHEGKALVGQIHYLSSDGKIGYTEQYYDVSAMQSAINESRDCGRPVDAQWVIDPPKKPMKEMSALELEETFLYEYGYDEELSADLADACLKDPSARTAGDRKLLESLHFLSVDKNDTVLKKFVDDLLYPNAYPAKPGIDTLISKAKSALSEQPSQDPGKPGKGRD